MDEIQQIKDRIDIATFIGEFITLKKAGKHFKALCPFHTEKSPSFVISPERQIWHCFGCQKGGDLYTFYMEWEKVEFSEALKDLAQRAGVQLTTSVARSETEKKRELYYAVNHLASQYYSYILLEHKAGKRALSYLSEKRKLSPELIAKFGLGYAPRAGSALCDFLIQKKHYRPEDLANAGLATFSGRRLYDFFRDRIIFPIKDVRGNVIAFSGRVLADNVNSPKYINTKETLIYKKGESLYGLFEAKDAIKREARAIVVEGEFDVISSFREGIPNTVAVKGTALTENQVKLLKRYTEKLSFCFDMDSAGLEAVRRSIPIIEKANLSATVIQPPDGKDPDEILSENPASYKIAIKKDVNMYDFLIDHSTSLHNIQNPEGKRKILDKVLPQLVLIENEVVREHYFRKLAGLLDTSLESIARQSEKIQLPFARATYENISIKKSRLESLEFYLLSLILQAKDLPKAISKSTECLLGVELITPSYNKLYSHIKTFLPGLTSPTVLELAKTMPAELLSISDTCYLSPLPHFDSEEQYFSEIHKTACDARIEAIKNNIRKISADIKEKERERDEANLLSLQREFSRLTQMLHRKS